MTEGLRLRLGNRRTVGRHTSSSDCGLSNKGNFSSVSSSSASASGVVEIASTATCDFETRDGGRACAVARREVHEVHLRRNPRRSTLPTGVVSHFSWHSRSSKEARATGRGKRYRTGGLLQGHPGRSWQTATYAGSYSTIDWGTATSTTFHLGERDCIEPGEIPNHKLLTYTNSHVLSFWSPFFFFPGSKHTKGRIMRTILSFLLLALASVVAAISTSGNRLLVVLDDVADKATYSKFFADLEG